MSNIITDLILIIYPMPIVIPMNIALKKYGPLHPPDAHRLTVRRKIEICILFSLGFIVIAISAVRLYIVAHHGFCPKWRGLVPPRHS